MTTYLLLRWWGESEHVGYWLNGDYEYKLSNISINLCILPFIQKIKPKYFIAMSNYSKFFLSFIFLFSYVLVGYAQSDFSQTSLDNFNSTTTTETILTQVENGLGLGLTVTGDDDDDCEGFTFCGDGTMWDPETSTCIVSSCLGDLNEDGHIQLNDLLDLLSIYGTFCD